MRPSQVKAKLRNNQAVVFYCLHFTDPSVWEMTSLLGFDCIWFDMEHHSHNMETATALFRAARVGGSEVICRPAKGEFMRMGRMLEAGAHGILYPRCENAAEAREVVRWGKFHPLGERGFDGGNPDNPYCAMPMPQYIKFANDNTYLMVQVEDPKSLENAEAMLAVDGIDGIMLGPGDFTVLSGIAGQFDHPKVFAALEKLAKAAKNTGKHWGCPTVPVLVDCMKANGAKLFFSGADLTVLKNGLIADRTRLEGYGVTFNDQMIAAGNGYLDAKK